jgi:hypothetical protein
MLYGPVKLLPLPTSYNNPLRQVYTDYLFEPLQDEMGRQSQGPIFGRVRAVERAGAASALTLEAGPFFGTNRTLL